MGEKTFSEKILDFYFELPSGIPLPEDVDLLYPFDEEDVRTALSEFYSKYFNDRKERAYIFGINPGRFGAGVTGIPFTDPYYLKEACGIDNPWNKKNELSSIFVYDFIQAMGGPEAFYSHFIISAVCPLGFVKNGKNYNYYDDTTLLSYVRPFIIKAIEKQLEIYCRRDIAFSLGKGTNYKFLEALNREYGWFERLLPLPHPRWVMQYQRKRYEEHKNFICQSLATALD